MRFILQLYTPHPERNNDLANQLHIFLFPFLPT